MDTSAGGAVKGEDDSEVQCAAAGLEHLAQHAQAGASEREGPGHQSVSRRSAGYIPPAEELENVGAHEGGHELSGAAADVAAQSPGAARQAAADDSRQGAGRKPSGYNGTRGSSYSRGSRKTQQVHCQVEGCGRDLVDEKDYYRRYKVCHAHAVEPSVMVRGAAQRFCQQCGTFHAITDFDQDKRSCRHALSLHNIKRRKRNPDGSAKPAAAPPMNSVPGPPSVPHSAQRRRSSAVPGGGSAGMAYGGSLGSEEEARMLMQRSGAARNPRADHITNSGDPFDSSTQQHMMRHSNMLAAGANPGLLAGLHNGGGPGALDASKFEAAAAARSAYDAMAAAAGAGNMAAIQQMEALRRQLGPALDLESMLSAMKRENGGAPNHLAAAAAFMAQQQQGRPGDGYAAGGLFRSTSDEPGIAAMNDAVRSAAMAAAAAGYLPSGALPGFGTTPFAAPAIAGRLGGLLTNSAPPPNMQNMAADFAASEFAPNGYAAQRASQAADAQSMQQENMQGRSSPGASNVCLGRALSSPTLPQGLTPDEYVAIARAIHEGAVGGQGNDAARGDSALHAARDAAIKMAMFHQQQQQEQQLMQAQQQAKAWLHRSSVPGSQAADQPARSQQQSAYGQSGPGSGTPPRPQRRSMDEPLPPGLTPEEAELIKAHRARAGGGGSSGAEEGGHREGTRSDGAPSHSPDSVKRMSSAFQPYGSAANLSALAQAGPPPGAGPPAVSAALAAFAAHLNQGPPGWQGAGAVQALQQSFAKAAADQCGGAAATAAFLRNSGLGGPALDRPHASLVTTSMGSGSGGGMEPPPRFPAGLATQSVRSSGSRSERDGGGGSGTGWPNMSQQQQQNLAAAALAFAQQGSGALRGVTNPTLITNSEPTSSAVWAALQVLQQQGQPGVAPGHASLNRQSPP